MPLVICDLEHTTDPATSQLCYPRQALAFLSKQKELFQWVANSLNFSSAKCTQAKDFPQGISVKS